MDEKQAVSEPQEEDVGYEEWCAASDDFRAEQRVLRENLDLEAHNRALQAQVDALTKDRDEAATIGIEQVLRAEAAEQEVSALREQLEKQWISVEEKRPELGVIVDLWTSGGFRYANASRELPGYYASWCWIDRNDGSADGHDLAELFDDFTITHWQPLPAPPAPQEKP